MTVPSNTLSTNINWGLLQFTGTAELPAGWVINATMTTELISTLAGLGGITDGGPTSAALSSYPVASGGTYNFVLDYAETNGAPAELVSNLTAAPEPSSLMLLGTGLLGAAGMLMRRRRSIV